MLYLVIIFYHEATNCVILEFGLLFCPLPASEALAPLSGDQSVISASVSQDQLLGQ